ncbi:MAG: anion permease [Bacteroides sp.]|jgi:phosphate/sulfate permease|nr:anion permease [Bacteroides sp.]
MISPFFSHLLIPFLVAMFLAINMGGSGTAPSFSAAYGANIIRRFSIPGLFGIFVFIGALVAGKKVSITMGREMLDPDEMTLVVTTIVLLSVSLSLFFANLLSVPQSTSQSAVFSLAGAALYLKDFNTRKLFVEIIPIWFLLPLIGFLMMLAICALYDYATRRWPFLKQRLVNPKVSRFLVLFSACYVAFAIGANNVANASGPLAGMVTNELGIDPADEKSFLVIAILTTLLIAPCFAIGSSLLGFRIVKTTGKGITSFGRNGAIAISFVTASLLLLVSITKGIPTSLVQLNAFAIMALSIHREGWQRTIFHRTLQKFWTVWLLAPAFAFMASYLLLMLSDKMGWLIF